MLERTIEKDIIDWINYSNEALLITGARQIGKTYIIRECLEKSNKSYIEFNFVKNPELLDLFKSAKTIDELLLRISIATNKPLIKNETIIFLDEVQEYKEIITLIKFLVEENSYKYILSGSLLGVELNDLRSVPVGYLRVIDMYPLTFFEFLKALKVNQHVFNHLDECFKELKKVDSYIHEKILDLFYLYLIIGGMPQAVDTYLETNNLQRVAEVHEKIVRLYKLDFSKYDKEHSLKLKEIYDSMVSELDAKNKRFKISSISDKKRYREIEEGFIWLKDAGVALPAFNVQEPKSPLKLSENRNLFKLFYSDVGLLTSMYPPIVKMKVLNKEKDINNGSLFENVVAQELTAKKIPLYYFNSKKQGELDFVIELDGKVCPLEVKSGKDFKKHNALENVLKNEEYKIEKAYIFSNSNIETIDNKIYLPIYMIMYLKNIELSHVIYSLDFPGIIGDE